MKNKTNQKRGNRNRRNNTHARQELFLLKKWLLELQIESKTKSVLVEGKKDRAALRKLGINSTQLHRTKKSLYETIEELSSKKECILLLDLDKQGKKLYGKVKAELKHNGVKTNSTFRNFLFVKTRLRVIEGLDTYLQNLQKTAT